MFLRKGGSLDPSAVFPPLSSLPSIPGISIWDHCDLHSTGERRSKWRREEPYENRWFLTVPEMTCKKKDDGDEGSYLNHLFILCSDPPLFLQSLWHGCTASHVIEVKPCEFLCQQAIHSSSGKTVVDIGSIDMEIRCLVALGGFQQLALAPSLLRPVAPTRLSHPFPLAVVEAARVQMMRLFPFNEDQQRVVDSVLAFVGAETTAPAIQLVQGVFGSGKSFLVAGLLILLHSLHQTRQVALRKDEETDFLHLSEDEAILQALAESPDEPLSVLFCSHTNVAVDRVCLLLRQHGFEHFRRTGNPRRIHPEVRSHYLSRASDGGTFLGVTCSTICGLPADQNYDVVIIDEASQVYEYYALLPILLARPQCVLLIGDQNQLPPVPIGTSFRRLLSRPPLRALAVALPATPAAVRAAAPPHAVPLPPCDRESGVLALLRRQAAERGEHGASSAVVFSIPASGVHPQRLVGDHAGRWLCFPTVM